VRTSQRFAHDVDGTLESIVDVARDEGSTTLSHLPRVDVTPLSYHASMRTLNVTGRSIFEESTVGSFTRNLPELLAAMATDDRTLLCLAQLADERYVQFWVGPSWTIFAEVVSNQNLRTSRALSEHDEKELRRLGFREPLPGYSPNWHFEAVDASSFARLVAMISVAITLALHATPDDPIRITTWERSTPKPDAPVTRRERVTRRRDDVLVSGLPSTSDRFAGVTGARVRESEATNFS
jgi:hypothetical protein